MTEHKYIGDELELFRHAVNWKGYYGGIIRPYFGETVLEVGAGIGATTETLCRGNEKRWVCLEPDPDLAAEIERKISGGQLPGCCEAISQQLRDLPATERFDSILYIDVLEHIENDAAELRSASERLNDSGHLIVVSPAHNALYTPFDKAIGHIRRYSKKTLAAAAPADLELVKMMYLDSAGALASAGNKLLLNQSMPGIGQILFWDRRLVPVSRAIDRLFGYRLGKSILAVWQKVPANRP